MFAFRVFQPSGFSDARLLFPVPLLFNDHTISIHSIFATIYVTQSENLVLLISGVLTTSGLNQETKTHEQVIIHLVFVNGRFSGSCSAMTLRSQRTHAVLSLIRIYLTYGIH